MGENIFELPLSGFWNYWVMGIIAINLLLVGWLIWWTKKIPAGQAKADGEPTGHEYDGIQELNNPLPKWWLYMFYISIVFGVAYFIIYPGFGNFAGTGMTGKGDWTQENQWQEEMNKADAKYAPIFEKFSAMAVEDIAKDKDGLKIGRRLFVNYCSVCHGTAATGAKDFPNLTDNDWLYGGTPEQIKTSIMNGRAGVMPPYGGVPLKDDELADVIAYVLSLSGREHDATSAGRGKDKFTLCGACHSPDGKGNVLIGAPNLTDKTWLHGRHQSAIENSIKQGFDGKKNRMPAFKDFLGEDKVHLLSAYIYSLSNK